MQTQPPTDMLSFVKAVKTSDGITHASLEDRRHPHHQARQQAARPNAGGGELFTTTMLSFVKAVKTSDGITHASLADAQQHELAMLFRGEVTTNDGQGYAALVIKYRDKIVDILTTKPGSKPSARKANGGTKQRKPKALPGTTALQADVMPV